MRQVTGQSTTTTTTYPKAVPHRSNLTPNPRPPDNEASFVGPREGKETEMAKAKPTNSKVSWKVAFPLGRLASLSQKKPKASIKER